MNLSEFVSMIHGGADGFGKLCHAVARKSLRRAMSIRDTMIEDSGVLDQMVDDAADVVMGEVLEKVGTYDPTIAKPSTWIYHIGWFVVANWHRSMLARAGTLQGHADRDGSGQQEATDSYLADHAGLLYRDADTLVDADEREGMLRALATLSPIDQTVCMDAHNGLTLAESAKNTGLSISTVHRTRESLKAKGFI